MNLKKGICKAVAALVLLAFLAGLPLSAAHAQITNCDAAPFKVSVSASHQTKADTQKITIDQKSPVKKIDHDCHCVAHCCSMQMPANSALYTVNMPVVKQVLIPGSDMLHFSAQATRLERPPRV